MRLTFIIIVISLVNLTFFSCNYEDTSQSEEYYSLKRKDSLEKYLIGKYKPLKNFTDYEYTYEKQDARFAHRPFLFYGKVSDITYQDTEMKITIFIDNNDSDFGDNYTAELAVPANTIYNIKADLKASNREVFFVATVNDVKSKSINVESSDRMLNRREFMIYGNIIEIVPIEKSK